jgi:hypothetical protein
MAPRRRHLHHWLRALVSVLVAVFFVLISVLIVVSQFSETSSKNEVLSLTSFIVILTFSSVAFNWCRVSPSFSTERVLKKVYQTGIDLLLSSLLALIASFFAWFQSTPEPGAPWLSKACLFLHWIFLSLAVVFFLLSILRLLAVIRREPCDAGEDSKEH